MPTRSQVIAAIDSLRGRTPTTPIQDTELADMLETWVNYFDNNGQIFPETFQAQLTEILDVYDEHVATFDQNIETAAEQRALAEAARNLTELFKNLAETAANNAGLGLLPKGSWNPVTNLPALSATPDPAFADGSYYDITFDSGSPTMPFAGDNFGIGQVITSGDRLKKIGTHWNLIKHSDLGLKTANELAAKLGFVQIVDLGNNEMVVSFTDRAGKEYLSITTAGRLRNPHIQEIDGKVAANQINILAAKNRLAELGFIQTIDYPDATVALSFTDLMSKELLSILKTGRLKNVHIQEIDGKIAILEAGASNIAPLLPMTGIFKMLGLNPYGHEFQILSKDGKQFVGIDASGNIYSPNIKKLEDSVFGGNAPGSGSMAISDTKILFGPHLFAVENREFTLFGASMLRTRSKNNDAYTFAIQSLVGGNPFQRIFQEDVRINPNNLGATLQLRLRNPLDDKEHVKDITVIKSLVNKVATPRYQAIGDSITQNSTAILKDKFTGMGVAPVFFGTRKTTTGAVWQEGRAGWRGSDFVYINNVNYPPLPLGSEAAYIAVGTDADNRNPFIRAAVGGDPAENVKNGYIFDYQFYLTRFGFTAPDIVTISIGTNDIFNDGYVTGVANALEAIRIMVTSIKAAAPACKIGITLPMPTYSAYFNPRWYSGYVPLLLSINQLYGNRSGEGIYVLSAHAYTSDQFIWSGPTLSTDAQTGEIISEVTDGVHHAGIFGMSLYTEPIFSFIHSIS